VVDPTLIQDPWISRDQLPRTFVSGHVLVVVESERALVHDLIDLCDHSRFCGIAASLEKPLFNQSTGLERVRADAVLERVVTSHWELRRVVFVLLEDDEPPPTAVVAELSTIMPVSILTLSVVWGPPCPCSRNRDVDRL
jgi:hypothetical protein